MNTILLTVFRSKTPDSKWLEDMIRCTGADGVFTSSPLGSTFSNVTHENFYGVEAMQKVKWMSKVVSPLVQLAAAQKPDAILFVHDDIKPEPHLKDIKSEFVGDLAFVSARPIKVGGLRGLPVVLDYSSRFVLWNPYSMLACWGDPLDQDFDTEGKTTLEIAMDKLGVMDVGFKFSDIPIKHTYEL